MHRGGGTGTEADPYLISTAQELKDFATKVNGGEKAANAVLTADIDLNNEAWTTICPTALYYGVTHYSDAGYRGTFDGAGYTIKNFTFTNSTSADVSCGLFGTVSGTIKNLGVDNVTFAPQGSRDYRTGAIAGQLITANGHITDCYASNVTIPENSHVAGVIAGCSYDGTIENCISYKSVAHGYQEQRYGYIVGDSIGDNSTGRPGIIRNCYTDGSRACSTQSGNIENCKGGITAEQFASGEIAALLQGDRAETVWGQLLTTDAYPVLGSKNRVYYGCYTDCIHKEYSNTDPGEGADKPKDHNYVNGVCIVCGLNNEGNYVIDTAEKLIAFAEKVNSGGTALNAIMTADISVSTADGFTPIGTSEAPYGGTFDGGNRTLTLDITGDTSLAAPFSYATGATVKNLTTAGKITTGGQYAAGMISRANNVTLENCLSTVVIGSRKSGDGTHGGLIGTVNGTADTPTTIINCGFAGAINGSITDSCGGMIGWTDDKTKSNISNSYVAATFNISKYGSDTFSRNPDYSTLTNCYYLTELKSVKVGAVQLTADQFASGAAAWKLNGEKTDGVWKQTLPTDTYPNFSGETVYEKYINCGKVEYTNDASQVTKPIDHTFGSNGVCTVCGATMKLELEADGTYHIETAVQLKMFADLVNCGNVNVKGKLMNNIDLSTVCSAENGSWTPIGNDTNKFVGTFDGQGHTISGLYINNSTAIYQGLFGYNDQSAEVKNLAVAGSVAGYERVGGVVGNTKGVVSDCSFSGSVSGSGWFVGGVCGINDKGTVENCFNTGSVSGKEYVGGMVGYNTPSSTVTNCYYLDTTAAGGINSADVTGQAEKRTAEQFKSGEVTWLLNGSEADGVWKQTLSTDAVPNFTGDTVYAKYKNCNEFTCTNTESEAVPPEPHSFGDNGLCTICGATRQITPDKDGTYHITSVDQLKAFAMLVNSSQTDICGKLMNNIDLSVICGAGKDSWTPIGNYTNRFVGTFDGQGHKISGLYINDSAADYQGLFGYADTGATIKNLAVGGSVTGKDNVGGVVGYNSGTVTNCSFSGTVTGTDNVGGVAGYSSGNYNCFNTGSVSGNIDVGGVVGQNYYGTVENCFNTGSVSGNIDVGGVVGYNYGRTVKNCFNTGSVSSKEYVGGVVGYNTSSGTVTNCYYLDTTATGGVNNSANATGQAEKKTAEQFGSGEVAHLLQGNQTEPVWGQTVSRTDKDATPVLVSSLMADLQSAKKVYKVTFMNGETTHATVYANPSGVGTDRIPSGPAAPENYIFDKWAENDTAAAFTDATTVDKDMTLYAYNVRRYINTVQKKITKEDTKDNSEATAVLSQINMNGDAIRSITWTYTAADNSEYTAKYTQEISGESTVYFGIVVPALLKAQENQTTDEIMVNIE